LRIGQANFYATLVGVDDSGLENNGAADVQIVFDVCRAKEV
jgi:hypothetical protein